MFGIKDFNSLLTKNESGNLEFKRQWYWEKGDSGEIIERGWGEFLKDFASLTNANSKLHREKRFLIFGVTDEKNLVGTELPEKDLVKFKIKIDTKFSTFFNFIPKYEILELEKESKKIIVMVIEQPTDILKVKKEFFDSKGNISRVNSIYVRGIMGKDDQIDLCDSNELFLICKVLNITIQPEDINSIENKIEYRNIDKAMECFLEINQLYSMEDGFPKNISNSALKYKSKLYELNDGFGNKITFLYVNSSSNIKQLIKRLKDDEIIQNNFTLITDQPIDIDPETRLNNISNSFKDFGKK